MRLLQKAPGPTEAGNTPKIILPCFPSSYRNALWESEKPLASVSFTIVQSKTSPARVLNVFPGRADIRQKGTELTPGQTKGP